MFFAKSIKRLQDYALRHHIAIKRAHSVSHLSYLTLVMTHGPYDIAAAVVLLITVVAYALHLEGID